MEDKKYAVVIGAANIDIGGTPYKPLIPGDSNPGVIKMSYGGVARNIAHNLTMLGVDVEFVTAAGDDPLGMEMLKRCEGTGMDTSLSIVVPGGSSSVYLFINDEKGEMDLALSHVDIVKNITPEYIESISDVINSAAVVVAYRFCRTPTLFSPTALVLVALCGGDSLRWSEIHNLFWCCHNLFPFMCVQLSCLQLAACKDSLPMVGDQEGY